MANVFSFPLLFFSEEGIGNVNIPELVWCPQNAGRKSESSILPSLQRVCSRRSCRMCVVWLHFREIVSCNHIVAWRPVMIRGNSVLHPWSNGKVDKC